MSNSLINLFTKANQITINFKWGKFDLFFTYFYGFRRLPDAVFSPADVTFGPHATTRRGWRKHRSYTHCTPCTHLQRDLGYDHQLQGFVSPLTGHAVCAVPRRVAKRVPVNSHVGFMTWSDYQITAFTISASVPKVPIRRYTISNTYSFAFCQIQPVRHSLHRWWTSHPGRGV